jgi:dihydrofolate synthase/folylpolyglutamate synthase
MTAMAFEFFADQQVDFAVIETGLGGRLDTTNVIEPLVSVITSISYDHTYILGNTLTEIAGEKAGIIKEGKPVVCAPQQPEALQVITDTCRERSAPLTLLGRDWLWERTEANMEGQRLRVSCQMLEGGGLLQQGTTEEFWVPFLGPYQVVNAATAIATLDQLLRQGVNLSLDNVRKGLEAARWPGRLEILSRDPLLIMDGAHNLDSMRRMLATLGDDLCFHRLIVVAGFSADKDIAGMMDELTARVDQLVLAKSIHPRSADPGQVAERYGVARTDTKIIEDVASALWSALDEAEPDDLVCVTGSFFVVAEARAAWLDAQGFDFQRDPPL